VLGKHEYTKHGQPVKMQDGRPVEELTFGEA